MIFSCLPPEGKCEWAHLRGFVDHFNTIYGKAYTRSKCLDVVTSNRKQPELLLEAPGEIAIVLERKSVVWPRNRYLSDHHNEHHLLDHFVSRLDLLGNPFGDSVYHLNLNAESLKGKSKKEINKFAEQIADIVLLGEIEAKSRPGIGNPDPIPWRFRPLSSEEIDETVPQNGIGIQVWGGEEPSEPSEIRLGIQKAKSGYTKEFECSARTAAEKFVEYDCCLKLLLVQFYGDSSIMLVDEDIIQIIRSAQLPEMIDQVWVARPEWVSQYDYEIAWERVRLAKSSLNAREFTGT